MPGTALSSASRFSADDAYRGLLKAAAALVFAVVGLIVFEAAQGSVLSIQTFGWGFLAWTEWDPVAERFGALPYMYGTLASSALALMLALPLGLGCAVY